MFPAAPPLPRSPAGRRRALLLALGALCAGTAARPASAAAFPTRPITLIVPFPPGGATDTQFRALAGAASRELKQPIVIANRPGVGGTLGPAAMARGSQPDGYTLSVMPASLFRLPHLQKVDWDPVRDFSYVIALTSYSFAVSVRADARWRTLAELLADAKANPGRISYGVTGSGSSGHVAMERLSRAAGAQMTFVPFKGAAEWQSAVLGGHIDVIGDPGWGPLARAGRLRVLATATAQRLLPDVPTLRELGYDLSVVSMLGIAGPQGMEPALVKRLHDAFLRASKSPAFARTLRNENQPYVHMDSAAYARHAAEQYEAGRRSVADLGAELRR